jgi:hypothetical protein
VDGFQAIIVVYYVIGYGLPTLLFYGWIVGFGRPAWRSYRRGAKSRAALFACVALLPLVWFGAIYAAAIARNTQLEAAVRDSEALPKLTNPPRLLVVDGGRADWQDRLVEMGAFDTVYVRWPAGAVWIENVRRPGCDGGARGNVSSQNIFRARAGFLVCATEIKGHAALPTEDGLYYRMVPPRPVGSRFLWLGFYELTVVEGGRERRVGFNGTPREYWPVLPPVLTVTGFLETETVREHIVPWHGDIPFLLGRLGLDDPAKLKPTAQPSATEVRAEFLRLRDSPTRADQNVAGYIATAVGASLLSADDIAPILKSDVVDRDFAREIGFQQFCYHINRLCDFPDELVAACKAKRGYLLDRVRYGEAAVRRCDRLPAQCNWCRTTPQCQPYLDGKVAACTSAASAARDEVLRPLREP